ncbi:alpha/beta hydrolase [Sphingobium sp. AN641]|uniref:alpha/beta fold hydrolase n=1 Tax=Sphingobium sp. AN641 TaxID=3133443 RepID=UPI0030C12219
MTYISDTVETLKIKGNLATYAYRDFGAKSSEPPLVLLQRFRGTIDHWDPAFLDVLASERRVIIFDNAGVGASTGEVPDTITAAAEGVMDFLKALKIEKVDVLGWSMGGMTALLTTLNNPAAVRRTLVLGSTPGGLPDPKEPDQRVFDAMTAPDPDDENYIFLFFGNHEEGRRLGIESLRRLDTRLLKSKAVVTPEAWGNQLQACMSFMGGKDAALDRLDEIQVPILVANGAHDVMVPSEHSFEMAKRSKNVTTVIYGDDGHGFLFPHYEDFGKIALDFLR